ncbi:MAG: WD40-repeat-containing domain protein [Olpidium bornovanus]|uniref:WD40-repeat-containing domain protein n=1 Tax=Olpidium bornovanus TaxID=278681 RepID=A0A8H7ZVD2_9FUNG|nr:MAG: WD40-repeat-containing domain protein [Olpidium bornovanus]
MTFRASSSAPPFSLIFRFRLRCPDASPGALRHTLQGHQGPIFALRWNKTGDLLLSAGVDGNVFVWDAKTGTAVQQFLVHKGPVMDADWRDDSMFATASSDNDVAVCQLGCKGAVRYFKGHKVVLPIGEVNTVRWDASGRDLASCSDDGTAKVKSMIFSANTEPRAAAAAAAAAARAQPVWTMDSDEPMVTLSHCREVYSLRWKPGETGSGAILATASFDHVVRLWEVHSGELVRPLAGHADTVYALEFDREGRRLATGGLDGGLAVWDAETGAMLARRYAGAGGSVFNIGWNRGGDRVAAAASDHTVIVLDVPS